MKKIMLAAILALGFVLAAPDRAAFAQLGVGRIDERDSDRDVYSVDFFYDALAPYGQWVQSTLDYGWVWVPDNIPEGWRPYTDGRWVYTDDYGWMWVSDVDWGWACYHYGRWYYDDEYGWAWVPGTQWAPAWVVWREGDDYIGWAPMPPDNYFETGAYDQPDYFDRPSFPLDLDVQVIESRVRPYWWCFVREDEFLEPRVDQYILPPTQNIVIIHNTVNITNYTVVNKRIINHGIKINRIERVTRRPLHHYMVRDMEVRDHGRIHGSAAQVGDREVRIYRPRIEHRAGERRLVDRPAPKPEIVQRSKGRGEQIRQRHVREVKNYEARGLDVKPTAEDRARRRVQPGQQPGQVQRGPAQQPAQTRQPVQTRPGVRPPAPSAQDQARREQEARRQAAEQRNRIEQPSPRRQPNQAPPSVTQQERQDQRVREDQLRRQQQERQAQPPTAPGRSNRATPPPVTINQDEHGQPLSDAEIRDLKARQDEAMQRGRQQQQDEARQQRLDQQRRQREAQDQQGEMRDQRGSGGQRGQGSQERRQRINSAPRPRGGGDASSQDLINQRQAEERQLMNDARQREEPNAPTEVERSRPAEERAPQNAEERRARPASRPPASDSETKRSAEPRRRESPPSARENSRQPEERRAPAREVQRSESSPSPREAARPAEERPAPPPREAHPPEAARQSREKSNDDDKDKDKDENKNPRRR